MTGLARLWLKRFAERLWVKPLVASLMSVAGVFAAKAADGTGLNDIVPEITVESIQTLLSIMASSVLVIASLAVTSMVSAYASVSNTASPRAFAIAVADDRTQYALSAFVAAFIFSIVALIASKNEYYDAAGRFALFTMTLLTLVVVVLTFVTWVDRIARLGRMGDTIKQMERATSKALCARRATPYLGGQPLRAPTGSGVAVFAEEVGFLQQIDMQGLQKAAVSADLRFELIALPGTFVTPDREIARCLSVTPVDGERLRTLVRDHFLIGRERTFEEDPRFGLVVLSQIAGRALSPAVNDPGTAIDIIGVFVRLFVEWSEPGGAEPTICCDRISVLALDASDLCDDAFTAIARDGASSVEVVMRLLKALETLSHLGDAPLRVAALRHVQRLATLADREAHLTADRALIATHRARVLQ